ncbi:hypothetical protein [Roseateles sp. LKC17W]|uniref:Uncharacterized protein n=1 Tax=Pelomonas margarita TaxID=3299031 RepID=A0ABW7FMK5_9BURK
MKAENVTPQTRAKNEAAKVWTELEACAADDKPRLDRLTRAWTRLITTPHGLPDDHDTITTESATRCN